MSKISKDSIVDQVYAILNEAIEEGRFAPGARIFEGELAEELGISKTPLRLALHQLRRDGVVRIEARKGIYLAKPAAKELAELIEIREVLEGVAARRCALLPSRRFTQDMADCMAPFSEKHLDEDRKAYGAADFRFHRIMVEASQSTELANALRTISLRLHQHRINDRKRSHDLRPIHREHLAIIKALKKGDPDEAERLVRAHVRHQLSLIKLQPNEENERDALFVIPSRATSQRRAGKTVR